MFPKTTLNKTEARAAAHAMHKLRDAADIVEFVLSEKLTSEQSQVNLDDAECMVRSAADQLYCIFRKNVLLPGPIITVYPIAKKDIAED